MDRLTFRTVSVGTREYQTSVRLRQQVLRWPIGLDFTEQDLAGDVDETILSLWNGALILGVLHVLPEGPGQHRVRQVAIEPTVQGVGLGRRLMLHAEAEIARLGSREVVLCARDSVIPFYERLDYKIISDGFIEVGIPHHSMSKSL